MHHDEKHKARRKKDKGFTLVEFLVSFTLVIILLTGTAQLIMHSLLVTRHADSNLRTAELVSRKLEHFKSFPFESDELKPGQYQEILNEKRSEIPFLMEWSIHDISWGLKRVEIQCMPQDKPQKTTGLVLLLSRELGF